jgi:hypothetical protein
MTNGHDKRKTIAAADASAQQGTNAPKSVNPVTPCAAAKVAENPATFALPADVCKQAEALWSKSFPGGKSQEHGGTLVKDASGKMALVNEGGGNSGGFSGNLNVPEGQEVLGVFHTHPYDETEGGFTDVSLSGGDFAYMINKGHKAVVAKSGSGLFVAMRTSKTPANVDYEKVSEESTKRLHELVRQGKTPAEASQLNAREDAAKYGLDYYEGTGCTARKVN